MDYYSILSKLSLNFILFILISANKFIYANTSTIEIAKPLENGISYNTFSELPSSQNSISFNNDILSNPKLDNTAAKIIIAEITSDKHSNLEGTIGIKGTIADLIIANPNGISWKNGKTDNVKNLSLIAGKLEIPAEKTLQQLKSLKFITTIGSNINLTEDRENTLPINNLVNIEAKINVAKLNLFADKIIINDNITLNAGQQHYLAATGAISYSLQRANIKLKHLIKPEPNLTYLHHSQLKLEQQAIIKGQNIFLESHPYQCSNSYSCKNKHIQLNGTLIAQNFSLRGDSLFENSGLLIFGRQP
ncbi:filamentous hemagglutinin N-terminal domain-containing protein [Arsenophonus nasoniae]|uniref:Filamentous hemagglutinin n=1 Tax=Arsenophonus nasoniae TaxID=638 RepID=D2U414_9GAMM|nr:filamentous hemagglutinin N-terminal domain-containing protein [Arsenophonus nasoniae]QBY45062.1 Filamentous hemagglutinin [Arsenophonus nasoniae]WGM05277.1 filamentous hemagglutinin N-terminal domain-containing protein [Arsenophonus nasoniae]WGM10287.1 filamentous hemagglutinin N-terminal domain-containing protein [Arsenophonus nasoniae]WGM15002.1 filamentous hemagglutinin N-terminal domain-containing protein [Arsenophonus nasoniae]CBA76223.1 filamentous hemagglutinin/adhesin [Arsenophonus